MNISSAKKLGFVIIILSITFLAEIIGGLVFGSLSLISDSIHVFSDIFSLTLAFLALKIALKKPETEKMTFGYHRLEVFSALFNGLTLTIISVYIIFEAFHRFRNPIEVIPVPSLIIAVVGLIINISSAIILKPSHSHHHEEDINLKSAYLHILGDALASVAVIIGMTVITFTGITVIDPIVAVIISIIILYGSIKVIKKAIEILLQKSPKNIEEIRNVLESINGVISVEDLHFWQVCSHLTIGTAHIIVSVEKIQETAAIDNEVRKLLDNKFNIKHMTSQYETPEMSTLHPHGGDLNH